MHAYPRRPFKLQLLQLLRLKVELLLLSFRSNLTKQLQWQKRAWL